MNGRAILIEPEIEPAVIFDAEVGRALDLAISRSMLPPGPGPLNPSTSTAPRAQCDTQHKGADAGAGRGFSAPFLTEEDF